MSGEAAVKEAAEAVTRPRNERSARGDGARDEGGGGGGEVLEMEMRIQRRRRRRRRRRTSGRLRRRQRCIPSSSADDEKVREALVMAVQSKRCVSRFVQTIRWFRDAIRLKEMKEAEKDKRESDCGGQSRG